MKFKRSIQNIIAGFASEILTFAIAFLLPKLYIVSYGSETNGLLSSVSQLFAYLALLEAGVGAASQQALYKYIKDYDKDNINGILSATNHYYRRTAFIYGMLVLALGLIYPFAVKSDIPTWKVTCVILLMGSTGTINFLFQGKYRILLTAEGKGFINSYVSMIATTTINLIKVILLICGYDIVAIQTGHLLVSVGQAVFYSIYISRKYPWIDLSVKPDLNAISQKNSALIHQITSLVFNNTDVLVLTFFTQDLKLVSIYAIYGLIYNNLDNVTTMVFSSYSPLLGQLYYEDRDRFTRLFESTEVFYMGFSYALYFTAYILTIPFIRLYTVGADINYVDSLIPVFFVAIKLLAQFRRPLMGIINLAGHFKQTRSRTITEAVINIVVSLALVYKFKIYGVLIGTSVAILYRNVDVLIYVPKYLVAHNRLNTVKRWFVYLAVFCAGAWLWSRSDIMVDSIGSLIAAGIVLTVSSLLVFEGTGAITNIKEANTLKRLVLSKIKH